MHECGAVSDVSSSNDATNFGQNWNAFLERWQQAESLLLSHHVLVDECSPHLHRKCSWVRFTGKCLESYAKSHRSLVPDFQSQMELLSLDVWDYFSRTDPESGLYLEKHGLEPNSLATRALLRSTRTQYTIRKFRFDDCAEFLLRASV